MYTFDKSSHKLRYRTFCEVFSSVREFEKTISERKPNKVMEKVRNGKYNSDLRGDKRTLFTGTESLADANKLLVHGDLENAKKVSAAVTKLSMADNSDNTRFYKKTTKSVCGAFPIVPLHIIGVPCNMMAQRNFTKRKPVVSIIANPSVNCDITASEIIKTGALLLSAINLLEKSGIRVCLYAGNFGEMARSWQGKGDLQIGFLIKLKEPDAPLNLPNIAYPLVHPSFLRRHDFKYLETAPADMEGIDRWDILSYGGAKDAEPIIKNLPQQEIKEAYCYNFGRIILRGEVANTTPEELAKKIIKHFEVK